MTQRFRPIGRRHLALATLAVAAVAACSDDGVARGEDGAITRAGSLSVYDVQLGDCIEVSPEVETELEEVDVVPCDDEHTHEVFFVDDETLEDRYDVYPGAPDVEGVAAAVCFDEFAGFVGSEVVDSELSFTYLYPTLKSWTDRDPPDRTIACLVVSGEPVTGSLAGSER